MGLEDIPISINVGTPSVAAPPRHSAVRDERPEFHQEVAIVGKVLHSYSTREPSEDGQYVTVVKHDEHIEKIKQPPTPEEIEKKRLEDRRAGRIALGILGGLAAVVGAFIYFDAKAQKREPVSSRPDLRLVESVETPDEVSA